MPLLIVSLLGLILVIFFSINRESYNQTYPQIEKSNKDSGKLIIILIILIILLVIYLNERFLGHI